MTNIVRHRLNLIRDSLVGVSYHLPNPEILLYPFLDYNLLLHQSPLVYAIWEGDQCIFSSLRDPDFLSRHTIRWHASPQTRVTIRNTPYAITVHNFPPIAPLNQTRVANLTSHAKATKLTESLLNEQGELGLPDEFFNSLGISIASQQNRQFSEECAAPKLQCIEISFDEVKTFLEPLRLAMDKIFEESIRSKALTIDKGNLRYPNVFTVVRTCSISAPRYQGAFNYTAGHLLLSQMRSAIENWCAETPLPELQEHCGEYSLAFANAEECLNAIQYPLGLNSRSVSDLVFSSGLVDFGRRASEKGWDVSEQSDPLDEQRRVIEKCIYPNDWSLFYIPIHVGGTPWLALFTFTPLNPASDSAAWHHNYCFYRDLAQKAGALIRQEAHDAYSVLLAKHFVKHMESWITPLDTILDRINHDAQKMAQVYPFPLVRFQRERSLSNGIFVPGRGHVSVNFICNPFFARQVSWHLGDNEEILRRCREAIGDFTRIEESIEINAVAQSSHLLKTPLRILDSIAAAAKADGTRALHRQVSKILDLHDIASSLMSEAKRGTFRTRHRKQGAILDVWNVLKDQYDTSKVYLVQPEVSGNLAPRFKALVSDNCIQLVAESWRNDGHTYSYYEPLIVALMDGLLNNAIDAVAQRSPNIVLQMVRCEETSNLFLCVENSTEIDGERLQDLVKSLNSPGPDMVGITELHWNSKACWPDIDTAARLSWTVLSNPNRILARAMIAEFTQ